jgi:predicted RNase H-like HicB family nuclease
MNDAYTAIIMQRERCWIGWIAQVPGVNAQAGTREGLLDDLQSALGEALEMNRADALAAMGSAPYEAVRLVLAA